jgi:TrkA domain protein
MGVEVEAAIDIGEPGATPGQLDLYGDEHNGPGGEAGHSGESPVPPSPPRPAHAGTIPGRFGAVRVDLGLNEGKTSPVPVPEIHETALPGVGVRHEFATRAGEHLGVVAHRRGRRDLVVYAAGDPDACRESLQLTAEESLALAELLTGPRVIRHDSESRHPVDGLAVDWVAVPPGSPFAGRSIAAAGVRSVTGVSIVAVLRQGTAFPSPRPEFVLNAGDTAVVVGSGDGIEAFVELLES